VGSLIQILKDIETEKQNSKLCEVLSI